MQQLLWVGEEEEEEEEEVVVVVVVVVGGRKCTFLKIGIGVACVCRCFHRLKSRFLMNLG